MNALLALCVHVFGDVAPPPPPTAELPPLLTNPDAQPMPPEPGELPDARPAPSGCAAFSAGVGLALIALGAARRRREVDA